MLCLDNEPQMREARQPERDEAAIRQTLDKEPWGSTRYRDALVQLQRFRKSREAQANGTSVPTVTRIEHRVPMELFVLAFAILPVLWMTGWKQRRPAGPVLRRLFNIGAALSLVLCLAIIFIWARSYWIGGEGWIFASHPIPLSLPYRDSKTYAVKTEWGAQRQIVVSKGSFQVLDAQHPSLVRGRIGLGPVGHQRGMSIIYPTNSVGSFTPPGQARWSVPGIDLFVRPAWTDGQYTMFSGLNSVIVSLWLPALASCFLPAWWLRGWRRSRRGRRRDHCPTCGYNLAGNTTGVCPECGGRVVL
jgi:hypothetical protein